MLYVNGAAYFGANVETTSYFLSNSAGGSNTGYYLYAHAV
jgi:hypothetical protein